MFVGKHVRQIDDKGRLAVPAEYLALLADQDREALYITPGKRGGIWLVPPSYYEGDFLAVAPLDGPGLPDEFFHVCQRRPLDKAGRILIDQDARALAGIPECSLAEGKVSVVICGSGRYLQVWTQEEHASKATPPRLIAQGMPGGGNSFPSSPGSGGGSNGSNGRRS